MEFEIIRDYFSTLGTVRDDVILGVGDDAALLQMPIGEQLVVTSDTSIAGVHFPVETAPYDIGWKALAVNLSDLAAMGATPRWFTLALTLPAMDADWLQGFAQGLHACATRYGVALIGGDTTRGALSITITAMGSVPVAKSLRRSGARLGDIVAVSGTLGDAAVALLAWQKRLSMPRALSQAVQVRLNRPTPRTELG